MHLNHHHSSRSGMYIYKQGHVQYPKPDMVLSPADLAPIMTETKTGHGLLRHLAPVLSMSETKPYWEKPSPVLGSSKPEWLDTKSNFESRMSKV